MKLFPQTQSINSEMLIEMILEIWSPIQKRVHDWIIYRRDQINFELFHEFCLVLLSFPLINNFQLIIAQTKG